MSVGLEDWVAQLTLWSGAPDLTGRALLLRDLRPICEDAAAQQRPALRLLLVGIAKALAAASIDTDHDDLAECSLAALEWQGGGDPGELGLVAPTERVLAAVGMPANRIATLLHALRQEALGQQRAEAVQPDASTQVTAEVVPAQLANVDASAESPPPDPSELFTFCDAWLTDARAVLVEPSQRHWQIFSDLVSLAHQHGLSVHPYTFRADAVPAFVSDFDGLMDVFIRGADIDGLFTDFPDRTREFVDRLGGD